MSKTIDLDRLALDVLKRQSPSISRLTCNDLWEKLRSPALKLLNARIGNCFAKQLCPNYVFSDLYDAKLVRYDIRGRDGNEQIRRRVAIFHRDGIIQALHELDWRTFEFICAYLLDVYGCTWTFVGRGSKEGGIDFCGVLELDSRKHMPLFSRVMNGPKMKILGQAKNWKNKVGQDTADAFIKKYGDVCKGRHKLIEKLPDSFTARDAPFYPVLITTSGFTKGAVESANMDRVILKDGEQSAEDLIMLSESEIVTRWFGGLDKEEPTFNEQEFMCWAEGLCSKYNDGRIVD